MRTWVIIGIVAAVVFLSGCDTFKQSRIVPVTPQLKEYSADEQEAVRQELIRCNCPNTQRWIADYGALRDAVRDLDGTD